MEEGSSTPVGVMGLGPSWLHRFVMSQGYFLPCPRCVGSEAETFSGVPRDKQLNLFVTDESECTTACAHCRECFERPGLTTTLQIRRSSHQDVVQLKEMQLLCPSACLGVQPYTINGLRVAFLRTRSVPREAKAGPRCNFCHRGIQEGHSFCSLQCKLHTDIQACMDQQCLVQYPSTPTKVSSVDKIGFSTNCPSESPSSSTNTVRTRFSPTVFSPELGQQNAHTQNHHFLPPSHSQTFRSMASPDQRKRRKLSVPQRSP